MIPIDCKITNISLYLFVIRIVFLFYMTLVQGNMNITKLSTGQ